MSHNSIKNDVQALQQYTADPKSDIKISRWSGRIYVNPKNKCSGIIARIFESILNKLFYYNKNTTVRILNDLFIYSSDTSLTPIDQTVKFVLHEFYKEIAEAQSIDSAVIIDLPGLLQQSWLKLEKQLLLDEIDAIIQSQPKDSQLSSKLAMLREMILSNPDRIVIDQTLLKDPKKVSVLLTPTIVKDEQIEVSNERENYESVSFTELLKSQMTLGKDDFLNIQTMGRDFPREVHRLKINSYGKPTYDFDVKNNENDNKQLKTDLLTSIEVISKKFGEFDNNFDFIIQEKINNDETPQTMIGDIVSKQNDSKTVKLIKAQSVTNTSPCAMLMGRFASNYHVDDAKTTIKNMVSFWDDRVVISTVVEYTMKRSTQSSTNEYFTFKVELNRTFDRDMTACSEMELKASGLDLSHIVHSETRKNIRELLTVNVKV